jgi:uncharacterized protein YggE
MKPAFLAAAAVFAFALYAPAWAEDAPLGPLLNLSAYGEVHAAPDLATISLGVTTQGATAAQAMGSNATQMSGLLAALKRQGIAEKDIQTSNLSLSAQYDYENGKAPVLKGYQASNTVTVTVRDLAKIGPTVDAVVAGGANQVNGISFGLRDPQSAEDAARVQAVQRLQAEAALYAKAAGLHVKALRSLSEGGGYEPSPVRPMMLMKAAAPAATQVEAGELDLRVQVQATYELEP